MEQKKVEVAPDGTYSSTIDVSVEECTASLNCSPFEDSSRSCFA
ncbi:MAG: hypothetical protein WCS17_05630 [Prevotella sp.]